MDAAQRSVRIRDILEEAGWERFLVYCHGCKERVAVREGQWSEEKKDTFICEDCPGEIKYDQMGWEDAMDLVLSSNAVEKWWSPQ